MARVPNTRLAAYGILGFPLAMAALPIYVHVPKFYADTLGVDLPQLDTTWRQYRIPFGGLTQRGFGLPRSKLDSSSIYTIEFNFNPITPFDFWVDDIAFY